MNADDTPRGPFFWLCSLLGSGVLVFGLVNLLARSGVTHPTSWIPFFLGGLVLHDAVLAPLVALAGWLLSRVEPRWLRPPLQLGAYVSFAVALVALPVVGGYGRLANNPTILPDQHYGRNLLLVLAAVWLVVALACLRAWMRRPAPAAPTPVPVRPQPRRLVIAPRREDPLHGRRDRDRAGRRAAAVDPRLARAGGVRRRAARAVRAAGAA